MIVELLVLNSAIVIDDVAYWMSDGQFFRYAGSVQEIPCPILNHVFDDINKVQYLKYMLHKILTFLK